MKKKKLIIHLITSTTQEQYNILGEYDKENGKIIYQESKDLVTDVVLDLNNKILTRKNKDYCLNYHLLEGKVTENEVIINDLQKSLYLNIKTNKFEITDNKVEIKYSILDSNEKVHYIVEF